MKETSHQEEPAPASTDPESCESAGRFLQRERLRQNKTLKELAETTCIHAHTLQAIEEDDRSKLPAEVFVRGFISIYAQHLGLDAQEALNRHSRKTSAEWISPGNNYASEDLFRENPGRRAAGKRTLLIVLLACTALLAYGGYRLLAPMAVLDHSGGGGHQLSSGGDEPAARPAADNQEETIPDGSGPSGLASSDPPDFIPESAVREVNPPEIGAWGDSLDAGELSGSPAFDPLSTPPVSPAEAETGAPSAPRPGDYAYVLAAEFTESTWLRIQIDNREPAEYLFQDGERHQWHARERINLFLGNAGGVDLTLNGQPQPKPGRSGRTARVIIPGRP